MPRIGHTESPVVTANTNRDGSGTLTLCHRVTNPAGEYVDTVAIRSLGTNVATEGVIIGTNGRGLANTRNNWLMGSADLPATTLGTWASTDEATIQVGVWLDFETEIYALVHDAQAAGRQFVASADPTYQQH